MGSAWRVRALQVRRRALGTPAPCCAAATSRITSKLRDQSKQYKWNAVQANRMAWLRTVAPWVIGALLLIAVLYWKFGT